MENSILLTPDPTTRAGRMLAAGDVRVTVTTASSPEHVTLRYKAYKDTRNVEGKNWTRVPFDEATHVFIEVPTPDDGAWADKVGTYYPPKDGYKTGRLFDDNNADIFRKTYAREVIEWLSGRTTSMGLEFREEERCGKCARRLTDPVSIERGIGPECYGAATGSQHQVKGHNESLAERVPEAPEAELTTPERPHLAEREEASTPARVINADLLIKAMQDMSISDLQRVAAVAETIAKEKGKAIAEGNPRSALRR